MFDFIREHQLNIMLLLCGACAAITILLLNTRFLAKSKKYILILMEVLAMLLLGFDRAAYIYAGQPGQKAYVMVRVSNFFVFFLTSAIVFAFNMYLSDWLRHEGKMEKTPVRLKVVYYAAAIGMLLSVISAFTGLYYYFDENNKYHRGPGFLLCYIIPVLCPLLQYTVIRQARKVFSKIIYISMVLYIFVPIACGLLQIVAYGTSIVNMSMVLVSIFLYLFTYLDINDTVERAHRIEIVNMQESRNRMKRLFDQTASAFVAAVEKRDELSQGHSARVADFSRRVAKAAGKSEEECEQVYYAALLHDVGKIGLPDAIVGREELNEEETAVFRTKPEIGGEILSRISEYPYISQGAKYSFERYDGKGFPEGLAGDKIPEIGRIVAVADAYDDMTSRKKDREPLPAMVVREEIMKEQGGRFDPVFSEYMLQILDQEYNKELNEDAALETELKCGKYRDAIATGVEIGREIIKIRFDCARLAQEDHGFSMPSFILFDSYDGRVHTGEKSIEAFHYLEYGEVWMDGHVICTSARDMKADVSRRLEAEIGEEDKNVPQPFEITAAKYEDHVKIEMETPYYRTVLVVALPDRTKSAYIALTGENCVITNIRVENTGEEIREWDIPRIVESVSYIDRMESDIPNLQVDTFRSASTKGIEIKDGLRLDFQALTLPSASLVWHCAYLVFFYSEDQRVGGEGYREYITLKLNGECDVDEEFVENKFSMKRSDAFPGWESWKEKCKQGMECRVEIERKGNRVNIYTENQGIIMEDVMTVKDFGSADKVYVALTGDECALTDIRIRNYEK